MASNDQLRNRKTNNKDLTEKIAHSKNESILSTQKSENKEDNYLNSFIEIYSDLLPKKSSYYLTRIVLIKFLAFIYGNKKF
jgi:hypothetical protein